MEVAQASLAELVPLCHFLACPFNLLLVLVFGVR